MSSKPNKNNRVHSGSFYRLSEVQQLVENNRVRVNRNALDGANDSFGWNIDDIMDALVRLRRKDFFKKDVLQSNKSVVVDYYKAYGLPIIFVDNLSAVKRNDQLHLVRLLTQLPEGLQEQVRTMIPAGALVAMIDALCKHCDHYPKPPAKKSAS